MLVDLDALVFMFIVFSMVFLVMTNALYTLHKNRFSLKAGRRMKKLNSTIKPADLVDHIKLTGRINIAGFCHVTGAGTIVQIAPSTAPDFDFDHRNYMPDISRVLNEKPKPQKAFDPRHYHICYICGFQERCSIISISGHRVICRGCESVLETVNQTSELNYQETIEKIYELAISSGAPEKEYDYAKRQALIEEFLAAESDEPKSGWPNAPRKCCPPPPRPRIDQRPPHGETTSKGRKSEPLRFPPR